MKSFDWRRRGRRQPRLEACEPRLLFSAEPVAGFQLDVTETAAAAAPAVEPLGSYDFAGLAAARAAYGFDGAGQTVAVIDSGIAYDHPALGGGFGSAYRVVGGWDFAENDANPYDDGPAGSHGTHVAGIVGAADATRGGVAPGVDLVALRVFDDSGAGNFDWVEKALQWVHANRNAFRNPITAVNMSLGANWNSASVPTWSTLEDELAQLKRDGIFISVAAGNGFANSNTAGLSYPAASPSVVPVASVDADGRLSSFSQRLDRVIAAPGRAILSTVPDYVGNFNRKTDDWAAYSGTSMAAPFVAGASVLVREALTFAGTVGITEDTIYSVLRNTADTVFDPLTNRNYFRLNLGRALDSVAPADDYGSTAATAKGLGTVSRASLAGVVGRLDDRDYFTFTAAQTGTAKFSATTSGKLQLAWAGPAGSTSAAGALSFQVVAGQTYTVGLGTSGGLGRYTIDVGIQAASIDLGQIDFRQLSGQRFAGDAWYTIAAARAGTLTVEALFSHAAGNIDLELYNGAGQRVGASTGTGNAERIDVAAGAGEIFSIRVRGTNAKVDLRLTNLLSQVGAAVTVAGTGGNDVFEFIAGPTGQVRINGVSYALAASAKSVTFYGGAGSDTARLVGTAAKESVTVRADSVRLVGGNFDVVAGETESVLVDAGAGDDQAVLFDSAGDDRLEAGPNGTVFSGRGWRHELRGVETVDARSAAGGFDVAVLTGTTGADVLVATPSATQISGRNWSAMARGFRKVEARSGGGADVAYFYDSAGDDSFIATPAFARLQGPGFDNLASGFARVEARRTGGGNDTARLYDSKGNDTLAAQGKSVSLSGTGYFNLVIGFGSVVVDGTAGGTNKRSLAATDVVFEWLGSWR